jgi:SPP1 family predicted phage head-tail adaptor
MYFSDRVKLRAVTSTADSEGFASESATETTVWADKHSIKRSEWFAASAAGVRVDIGFVVRGEDYANQTELEYAGQIYDIVRSYAVDGGRVDLTCARR